MDRLNGCGRWAASRFRSAPVDKLGLPFFINLGAFLGPLATLDTSVSTKGQILVHALAIRSSLQSLLLSFDDPKSMQGESASVRAGDFRNLGNVTGRHAAKLVRASIVE